MRNDDRGEYAFLFDTENPRYAGDYSVIRVSVVRVVEEQGVNRIRNEMDESIGGVCVRAQGNDKDEKRHMYGTEFGWTPGGSFARPAEAKRVAAMLAKVERALAKHEQIYGRAENFQTWVARIADALKIRLGVRHIGDRKPFSGSYDDLLWEIRPIGETIDRVTHCIRRWESHEDHTLNLRAKI